MKHENCEIQVYTLEEACKKLGIQPEDAGRMLAEGRFPFPAVPLPAGGWLVARKPIDKFLAGQVRRQAGPSGKPIGGKRRWEPSAVVHYNLRVPKDLDRRFETLCRNMNASLVEPLTKGQFVRLAMEEFIQRRPEYW